MRSIAMYLSPLILVTACSVPLDAEPAGPNEETTSHEEELVVTLEPDRDTWTRQTRGGWVDWGKALELRTNNDQSDVPDERIFLRFPIDLNLVCPTLMNATLSLRSAQFRGPLQVFSYLVTGPWVEGATGFVPIPAPPLCITNSGDPAPFNMPPVMGPLTLAVITPPPPPCLDYTWNVTPIVQNYCATGVNHGIMLRGHNPNNMGSVANFFSREAAFAVRRPKLHISY